MSYDFDKVFCLAGGRRSQCAVNQWRHTESINVRLNVNISPQLTFVLFSVDELLKSEH